ncbi:hypothetical protein AJ78_02575 [Emergomyces pasteurianus Ep9510]|uniref:Uncharacterized protein n=1 Tax=Emergomyces pasteurianus Ep9510 TaxID=1447872 RepID=A0A1J9PLN3_9EURO|nr:hypothetical protein AJ78_02575 [Emergomyces pasteurianus Ep9510]
MFSTRVLSTPRIRPSLLYTRKFKLADAHHVCRRPIHISLRNTCRDIEDEEFSSLSEEQLKQVYAGVYPTDFPREALRLKTTQQEFSLLLNKFNNPERDKYKVKHLRFNRELSATSILHRPSPIHEKLIKVTRDALNNHFSSRNIAIPFDMDSNSTFYIGVDRSDMFCFIPDLAISSTPQQPFLVLEVGFSENYNDMLETAKKVLSGSPKTELSVIMKIIEKPIFRSPLKLSDYLFKSRSDIPIPSPLTLKDCYPSNMNPESPILINDLRWVGKISAFWEIWGRDASGHPVIIGERVWLHNSSAHSDFLKLNLTGLSEDCGEVAIKNSALAQAIYESRAQNTQGLEVPGNYNRAFLTKLFHERSSRLLIIARRHIHRVNEGTSIFVTRVLAHVVREEYARRDIHKILDRSLQSNLRHRAGRVAKALRRRTHSANHIDPLLHGQHPESRSR